MDVVSFIRRSLSVLLFTLHLKVNCYLPFLAFVFTQDSCSSPAESDKDKKKEKDEKKVNLYFKLKGS